MATFKQINLHQRVQTAYVGHRTQKPETGVNLFTAPKKLGRTNSLSKFKSGRENMNKTGLHFSVKQKSAGPINDLQEADRRGRVQRHGDIKISLSTTFDGCTTKEMMQDGPIKTFKNETIVDPMRNKKNDSNVKLKDETVVGQNKSQMFDYLRPNTANNNGFQEQSRFLESQSQHQKSMRVRQTNIFALNQGAARSVVYEEDRKQGWNNSVSQSEQKDAAKMYASLQQYQSNQATQNQLQSKLKQQNFNAHMNGGSQQYRSARSAEKGSFSNHGHRLTKKEMNDVLNIYSNMKKNSVPVMNNETKSTRFASNAQIRQSQPGPEHKKIVDGEMNGNKGENERTNLPFSKDMTPAAAQVDGQYGSTMYSLKQKAPAPKYIASNYNTNCDLNHGRHDDQLVQHHKVGFEKKMNLHTEKGKAFSLTGDKLQSHNGYFQSKEGPNTLSINNKATIEKQNFEVQIRNHSVKDFDKPFGYQKPTGSINFSGDMINHRTTNFSFGSKTGAQSEVKKQDFSCNAPDRIALGSGAAATHGKSSVFMGRDNTNFRQGSDYRQNFNKPNPSIWSKPAPTPQVFKPSTAAAGTRPVFNVPGGFQKRSNNIF